MKSEVKKRTHEQLNKTRKMNRPVFYILFIVLFISGCNSENIEKAAVEGSYVGQFKSEYSIAFDTIRINPYNINSGVFSIVHKTGYNRLTNNMVEVKRYKKKEFTGIWNNETRQLNEQRFGRAYSFSPDGKSLLLGSALYKKIE